MPTQWGRKETIIWPPHSPIYTYGAMFLAVVLTGAFLYMRFAFAMTPLQQFYTPIYLRSSLAAELGKARKDKYRMLFEAGKTVAAKPAVDGDLVPGITEQAGAKPIPLALADDARRAGYVALYRGAETSYFDVPLRDYLRQSIYGGSTLWDIYKQPFGFGLLALLAQLPFSIRKDMKRRREMKYGRRLKGPVMLTPKQFNATIGGEGVGFKTTEAKELMRIPARYEAQHIELMGDTGAGKTESLRAICAGAEAEGFAVEGFAPTNRAANQLRDAGINAETLQRFLARGSTGESAGDPAGRHLYMVDESSLTSTKQMQAFMEKLGPQDRVLLIGDIRQHQGVDAGKPFEQLQAEGMRTSQLDQIMRQKEQPELLRAVELLSQNRTVDGVQLLQEQGRVHEHAERSERIAAIARAYLSQPENTLVISPDNASRVELNQAIRAELRGVDGLRGPDREFAVLMPRSDLSSADRVWAAQYQPNDVLQYTRGSKELGLEPYSYATVRAVDTKLNQISVERGDGGQVSYDPKRLQGITAYREVTREFAEGDRIQFTANNRELQIANRQLGIIENIRPHEMTVRVEGQTPRSVTFDPQQMRHFDHGYAVTSHSSQGLTADRVLINVEVSAHRDLINQRFAYVAVSRAAHDVQLYTDNAARLTKDLSRDVSKTAALELNQPKAAQTVNQQRGEAMTYRKEHAEEMQPYQPTSQVPPSIYATSIDRETVLTDLRWSQEQARNGDDPVDTARAIAERHAQVAGSEQDQRALIERYADRVAELAYKGPDMPVERHAAQLEPTSEEKRHWEPLIQSIGVEHAEPFAWRKEHAEIQSYRHDENRGWLHIDSHGQFFDRNAQPIAAQVALEPFGLSTAASRGNEQSAGLNKETPTDSGYGISL